MAGLIFEVGYNLFMPIVRWFYLRIKYPDKEERARKIKQMHQGDSRLLRHI